LVALGGGFLGGFCIASAHVVLLTQQPASLGEDMLDFDGGRLSGRSDFGGSGCAGGMGLSSERRPLKVPVSILCGFLGAGKTTVIQHILKNREGMKVGVVVNDVAEANIDSEVLKFDDADGIVGLQNGCACCSGRDDLFARLLELVDSSGVSKLDRRWDRMVVECSGVAEPESIAQELDAMGRRGEPVMRRLFLAGIICVVDASTFAELYYSADAGDPDRKPLSALLVSQLESADTVVINKADLIDQTELERLSELLRALNPNARCLVSTKGALPLRTLLPAEPIDLDMPAYVPTLANRHSVAVRHATVVLVPPDGACAEDKVQGGSHSQNHIDGHSDGHSHHGHSHVHEDGTDCSACTARSSASRHARFGLESFVYRCTDRKFDPRHLAAAARQLPVIVADLEFANAPEGAVDPSRAFEGVVRSKGFIRIAGSEVAYYWSHAGRRLRISPAPSAPCKGQELVFIGPGMNREAITQTLEACLDMDAGARL